ncbi:mechanosensitive ion channel family protein [Grimontia sp. NTOU-MAR1]|uniref:mechanosensitive ion channel family protein n=1 Tax=Grimontia sp. NTOU-MAR1 TaxID=3111011 RepID=UPI002DB76C27|nr:mechanosensitive ion channel domain-containing protein [Grimontia sp. NTOU-MAR1]WRV99732.1 mechanosensitive ion channel domain-containing protein [Grimontia sp. NTOU-MAR1]
MVIDNLYIYLGTVSVVGIAVILWATSALLKSKSSRERRLRRLKNFNSVQTSLPKAEGQIGEIDAAVEKIENRFSIIRKITFFFIFIVLGLALSLPFLNSMPAAMVSLMVAVSTTVLGFAAKPVIENIIAGVVLSLSKAIRVGDTVVIEDQYGTVEDISLNHTIIKLWNWKRLIIPSSKMLSLELESFTYNDTYIWVHVEFYTSYENDLELVRQMAIESVQSSKHFISQESPDFWVMNLDKDAYQCWVAGWTNSATRAWNLASDIRTGIAVRFQAAGIKTHNVQVKMEPRAKSSEHSSELHTLSRSNRVGGVP